MEPSAKQSTQHTSFTREHIDYFSLNEDIVHVLRDHVHWSQAGTLCFITWRLGDSLPQKVLSDLERELQQIEEETRPLAASSVGNHNKIEERRRRILHTRDKYLDAGNGNCYFRDPEIARLVLEALLHLDEQEHFVTDLVVMPNHVHFIAAFSDPSSMLGRCTSWKRYIARAVNQRIERRGSLWQTDQFDHLIGSETWFCHFRDYIAENPVAANLRPGEFLHFSKDLT